MDAVRSRLPVNLDLTLGVLCHGAGDPTIVRARDGAWWRALRSPLGPATVRYAASATAREVEVAAWGPGAAWAVEAAPDALGARDRLDGFRPPPGSIVERAHHRFPGLRLTRTNGAFDPAVRAILGQKVTVVEAARSYLDLVGAWGDPAPAPAAPWPSTAHGGRVGLRVPPAPAATASRPYSDFHRFGIERRRAETLRTVAAHAGKLDAWLDLPAAEVGRRLCLLPGVGPWTAAHVTALAMGDPDAVPLGDYHLPNVVAWALAGEPRADDERMLDLLAPFAGHRGRVLRLLRAAGVRAPAFGPHRPLRSIRAY